MTCEHATAWQSSKIFRGLTGPYEWLWSSLGGDPKACTSCPCRISSNSLSAFGDVNREALQRVYGVSFPSQKLLKEHLDKLEKAKKSNHMLVGKNQSLYHFSSE